tara:strand:- start:423 stop:707 length:285 start_codon:yes stop_codon:yes gene_type:complete
MKSFKQYLEEVKKPTGKLKDACWTGYTAVGMKNKGGRQVPNCVPVKEDGAVSAGPTNAVSSGAIAGTGGKGGEPGVSKKRNPVMAPTFKRNPPQ